MMKINLLPRSINERKVVKNVAITFGVLVVAVILIGVLYTQMVMIPKVQSMESEAQRVETLEQVVMGIEKERDGWKGKIPPIKQKLDFIKGVLDYNLKYPRLYEEVAKWTYEKVAYTGLTCDGTQMAMSARAKSLDDLGRFLLNMYRATDLFTEVTISGVPGYGAAGAQPSFGGAPGMGMEMPGMMPPPMPMPGMGMSEGGPLGANMSGMGAITVGAIRTAGPRYIEFSVNCKLKTPITAPAFAGAAAPGAAGAPVSPGMPGPGPMPGGP